MALKRPESAGKHQRVDLSSMYVMFLVSCAAGCVVVPVLLSAVALVTLPNRLSAAFLGLMAVLAVVPISDRGVWATRFARDMCNAAYEWFSLRIICNEEKFLVQGPFVIGIVPHGVLPTAMPTVCNSLVRKLPGNIGTCYALATSAVFRMPVMRHVWWYLDLRPASRAWFHRLLSQGHSVGLSPGGVREVIDMEPGVEVGYLTRRLGFVRIALQHGAPLCPAFAFGQTDCFHYWRPGPPIASKEFVKKVARKLGFAPLLLWGKFGSTLPVDNPVTLVIGDPILVPRIENPTDKECQKYLSQFIADLKALFYKHRADAGYPEQELVVL